MNKQQYLFYKYKHTKNGMHRLTTYLSISFLKKNKNKQNNGQSSFSICTFSVHTAAQPSSSVCKSVFLLRWHAWSDIIQKTALRNNERQLGPHVKVMEKPVRPQENCKNWCALLALLALTSTSDPEWWLQFYSTSKVRPPESEQLLEIPQRAFNLDVAQKPTVELVISEGYLMIFN